MLKQTKTHKNPEAGQSLIETIGAIFILTMALTTALGLAVYALSRSAISQNEIVATNLAREGIDVIRAMRDSNWLAGATSTDASYNLTTCSDVSDTYCYPKANTGPTYDLHVPGKKRIVFNSTNGTWSIDNTPGYDLYLQSDGTYSSTPSGSSTFARMIDITFNSSPPYSSQNSNQQMIVKSVVAWRGKNCTSFSTNQDLLSLNTPCKIVTEEDLTNWKDYR